MTRTVSAIEAAESDAGRTVQRVMHERLGVSNAEAKGLIASGCVTRNRRVVTRPDERVVAKDRLVVASEAGRNYRAVPSRSRGGEGWRVVHEDDDLIVVDKDAGVLTVPTAAPAGDSLEELLLASFRKRGHKKPVLHVVHRIDRFTSGLVVFARHHAAAMALKDQFKARTPERVYLALAEGRVEPDRGRLTHGLVENPKSLKVQVVAKEGEGRDASLRYRVVERFSDTTLVEVALETGRRNQIRVQFAATGHPIVGDVSYRRPSAWIPRVALHAHRLAFEAPRGRKRLRFESPVPPDFKRLVSKARAGVSIVPPPEPAAEPERHPAVATRRPRSKTLRGVFALLVALWAWSACPAEGAAVSADANFPCTEPMREGVDFWKNVWTRWSLAQVVLHDTDHPSIVYEVFDLPPPVGETYTEEQTAFVKGRREALEQRLATVEQKVAAADPLADDEKALVLKITGTAGAGAIAGASQRVRSQRGLRERFRRGLEVSSRYHDAFVSAFREAGIPEALADLPHVESSFQAAARSSAGAVGVWQFTRGAARKFMTLTSGLDERLDPVAAARGAARYLRAAFDELGSWPLAVTAYNHGIEGMRAARDRLGSDFDRILAEYDGRSFGFASKNFYKEFLAAREIVRDPKAYFPEGFAAEAPIDHERVTLDRPTPAAKVAARYGLSMDALAAINPAWTSRALKGKVELPAGTQVWLPKGTLARVAGTAKKPHAHAGSLTNGQ